MSNALPRFMYGDPLEAMIQIEAGSCKGCKFEITEKLFGEKLKRCQKDKKHGTRCNKYIERGVNESIG
jgi:hypothetical protein